MNSATPGPLPATLLSVDSRTVVDVSGADTESFLQGQLCNDLNAVLRAEGDAPGKAILNGYCTPKGRLLALPLVTGIPGGYRLVFPEVLQESLLKRLRMFVLRADVQFTPRPDLTVIGLQGAANAALSQELESLTLPEGELAVSGNGDTQSIRWFDGEDGLARWLLILPAGSGQSLLATAEASEVDVQSSEDDWRLGDIHSGVADIVVETSDAFIPQMVNLQQVGGLSFTKGCYPGQEIVARMQYLGKLKRHMVHLKLPTDSRVPAPGETLSTPEMEAAAEVVTAVAAADGIHLLAVIRIGIDIESLSVDGQACQVVELPYELPEPQRQGDKR